MVKYKVRGETMERKNVTREFLSKINEALINNNSKKLDDIYNLLLQDKLIFPSHEIFVYLLNILLEYKWREFTNKHYDALFYMKLSNYITHNKEQETIELWHLFKLIDFEIALSIIEEDDPVPEDIKVHVVELYSLYFLLCFRHIKCIEKSADGLARDSANPTLNFFRASLLDLCFIVKHNSDYKLALENYRKTMIKNINSFNDVKFDNNIVSIVLSQSNKAKQPFPLSKICTFIEATPDNYDYGVENYGWSEEKEYYLKNKLFLNPLNSYGNFYECSFEEFLPLDLEQRHLEFFDAIIDDYKICRKKVFEFEIKKTVSKREMCSFYCFMYSIYDKVAYLLKKVYNINVKEDKISFVQNNLFDKEYNNKDKKFYEMNNPMLIPLYFEMLSVRNKNKFGGIHVGTFELNEFRNNIEHKSTLFYEPSLERNTKVLIKGVRDLIIYTYLLLSSAKANLETDKMIALNTAYVSALKKQLETPC